MSTLRNKPTDYATTIALQTYATEEEFKCALASKREFVRNLSYIVHDKDNADPHIHAVLTLSQSMQLKRVCGWFKTCKDSKGEISNTFCEELLSAEAMEDYLTHAGEGQVGKHQYNESEIKVLEGIQDARGYLKGKLDLARESKERKEARREETEDENETLLNDVIAQKPRREMARKYGRDYMKNHKAYAEFAGLVVLEETGDIERAFALMDGTTARIDEVRKQARTMGEIDGATAVLNSLAEYVDKRIERGESFLSDFRGVLYAMKRSIQ